MSNNASGYSLQALADALGGVISGGGVLAPGPRHSTSDRSMSVKLDAAAEGGFVVHSFAGDDAIVCRDLVRNRLGLPAWQPKKGNGHTPDPPRSLASASPSRRSPPRSPSPSSPSSAPSGEPKITATYDYRDADGSLLYQVLRFEPKDFRQRAADGTYKLDGVKRVLFRLPELIEDSAAFVFLAEGEKDCLRLVDLQLCATTISGGTKWTPELVEPLRGRDVVILPDCDAPGAMKALEAATALHGIANSVRVVRLPGLLGKPGSKDVSDWLDYDENRAGILATTCLAAPLWVPGAEAKKDDAAPVVLEPLPFIDMSKWRVDQAPEREWAVRDLIPMRNVFLLSGEGAAGKTLLMLQLGIAHALGKDWIGTLPEPGPFLYLGAEDDTDELHRRLDDILKLYRADFPDLADRVHLLSYAGEDAVLACTNSKAGIVTPTALFERLLKAASGIKPVMIGIDTSADVFAGSEIDRSQVRQFVGLLRKLAINANAAVIVTTHPSLAGINSGTGLSGSTAWHNTVRARAYLTTMKTDKDEEPDPNLRILEFKKNNYGPVARSIALRWENGVYKPVASLGSFDKLAAERSAETVFLALLLRFNSQNRNASPNPGQTFAPTIFSREPEAKGLKIGALKDAMSRLFENNQIHTELVGPPSHQRARLLAGPRP
jgi:RecA-family ATPase